MSVFLYLCYEMKEKGRKIFEACTASAADVKAAREGGAARIELCQALEVDGLTPSVGLLQSALAEKGDMTVNVLIRSREGDFVYSNEEGETMRRQIREVLDAGADGVVVGALTPEGDIDEGLCRRWLDEAGKDVEVTFHRAFDYCRNRKEGLEKLIELGFARVLTSAGAPSAPEGIEALKTLVEQASGRIIVMPGGGVKSGNAAEILKKTGACELHGSARIGTAHTQSREVASIVELLKDCEL